MLIKYYKTTFIRKREIFAKFVRVLSFAMKQSLQLGYFINMGVDKAWSQKLVAANQLIPG